MACLKKVTLKEKTIERATKTILLSTPEEQALNSECKPSTKMSPPAHLEN